MPVTVASNGTAINVVWISSDLDKPVAIPVTD